jgi:hypothetical protein
MTRLERKHQLQECYRMSCGPDAEVLLWALRVVDDHDPSTWADQIARKGGPPKGRTTTTLKRLGVQGV